MSNPRHTGRPPLPRPVRGPRPLPLHLNLSLSSWLSSPAGLMLSTNGLIPPVSPEALELNVLAQRLLRLSPKPLPNQPQSANPLAVLLARVVGQKLNRLLDGVERYHAAPYHRTLIDPPPVWQEGSTRLLDYGGSGPLVVLVPSLINKAYILDLNEERSLARWLREQGLHPLLIDWGAPGPTERSFALTDYIARLERAMQSLGAPAHLLGYCMGGNIALALAGRRRVPLHSLMLLATPWDFHAGDKAGAERSAELYRAWRPACAPLGELPTDLIQTLFALVEPLATQQKFMRFAEMTDPDEIENFVVLEDWLNDGVPLALGVADECLLGWYGDNMLVRGEWLVRPDEVDVPAFVLMPMQDKIVPPSSTEPLALAMHRCRRQRVDLGHVGMIVSRAAPEAVWYPLARWMMG